jgi:hypothetical protein
VNEWDEKGASPDVSSAGRRPAAFITAHSLNTLREVEDVLDRAGFAAVVATDIDVAARSSAEAALAAIKECDLVVGVLAATGENAAVLVELGMALAVGVRVIVVDEARVAANIAELSGAAVIKAAPGDVRPLEQALARLPYGQRPLKPEQPKPSRPRKRRRGPITSVPGRDRTHDGLVSALSTAFEQANAVAVARETPEDRFDLGIWSGALESVVGNPFLIEIKVRLPEPAALERLFRDIAARIEDSNVRWAGLVVERGDIEAAEELARNYPVLVFQADELLNELGSGDPWRIFRRSRSERVHG